MRLKHEKMQNNNRKGLSAIVATLLLLVTAVGAIIGFQLWFNQYETSLFSNIENKDVTSNLEIVSLNQNLLYLKSESSINVSSLKIFSEEGIEMCSYNSGYDNNEILFHFNMESQNSSNVLDSSGNNFHFNISGSPSFPGSRVGKSIKFDGTSDYLIAEESNLMQPNITLLFWAKRGENLNFLETFMALGRGADNRYVSNTHIENDTFRIFDDIADENQINSSSNGEFLNNTWYHLTYVFNENGSKKFYINSELNVSDADGLNLTNIGIPQIHFGAGNQETSLFSGELDEIFYINKSLNSEEISNLYNFNNLTLQLQDGVTKIAIPGCFLELKKTYQVVVSTGDRVLQKNFVAK